MPAYFYIMDATAIALKLNDCHTEMPGEKELWEEVCARYPYFAAARLMQFATNREEEGSLPLAALFKNDPYLFAAWVHDAAFRTQKSEAESTESVAESSVPQQEEAETVMVAVDRTDALTVTDTPEPPAEDILTLINELPNSNPISQARLERAEQEVEEHTDTTEIVPEVSIPQPAKDLSEDDPERALMVMMSFTDWLTYFKTKRELEQEEERDKRALKTSWQKEKLAAAVEEDVDEIPEPIFRQAMDSISSGSEIISEGLAKILASQGKIDRAVDMYKKLSLRNPEKRSYFADLIEKLNSNRD